MSHYLGLVGSETLDSMIDVGIRKDVDGRLGVEPQLTNSESVKRPRSLMFKYDENGVKDGKLESLLENEEYLDEALVILKAKEKAHRERLLKKAKDQAKGSDEEKEIDKKKEDAEKEEV